MFHYRTYITGTTLHYQNKDDLSSNSDPLATFKPGEQKSKLTVPITEEEQVDRNGSDSTTSGTTNGPEVFLGGSCNPTTWRADVAIPALDQLGISFYNPVSFPFDVSRLPSF